MSEQQSSTVVAFRALVMLVCLIAIPLAALFGSSLPTLLKALKEGRWPVASTAQAQNTAGEGPKFVPAGQANGAAGSAPPYTPGNASRLPTGTDLSAPAPAWPDSRSPGTQSGVVPAGYDTAADPPGNQGLGRLAPVNPGVQPDATGPLDRRLVPVQPGGPNLLPVDPAGNPASGDATGGPAKQTADGTAPSPGAPEPFLTIQARLQQLGATRYILETFGDQGRDYRFICWMAVGGNPKYTRPFWAIDSDPLKAMNQVLQQVEASRAARMTN